MKTRFMVTAALVFGVLLFIGGTSALMVQWWGLPGFVLWMALSCAFSAFFAKIVFDRRKKQ